MRSPSTSDARLRDLTVLGAVMAVAILLVACGPASAAHEFPRRTVVRASAQVPTATGWNPTRRVVLRGRVVPPPTSTPPTSTPPTSTPPASTPTRTSRPRPRPRPQHAPPPVSPGLVAERVTVIGDSVTVDAAPALLELIPHCHVDAVVGMQWSSGVALLDQLRSKGQLGQYIVVALGTNGPVSTSDFAAMMAAARGASRVVIVTDHAPDYWEEQNNAMFESEVRRYPQDRIANWDLLARAHPSWLYSDGTHMPIGGEGAYGWARLVKAEL